MARQTFLLACLYPSPATPALPVEERKRGEEGKSARRDMRCALSANDNNACGVTYAGIKRRAGKAWRGAWLARRQRQHGAPASHSVNGRGRR